MNHNIFCARKGGATINKKFHRCMTVNEQLAKRIERQNEKKDAKLRRAAERQRLDMGSPLPIWW